MRLEIERLKADLSAYEEALKSIKSSLESNTNNEDNKDNEGETQSEERNI